jgi:hypothetical protein
MSCSLCFCWIQFFHMQLLSTTTWLLRLRVTSAWRDSKACAVVGGMRSEWLLPFLQPPRKYRWGSRPLSQRESSIRNMTSSPLLPKWESLYNTLNDLIDNGQSTNLFNSVGCLLPGLASTVRGMDVNWRPGVRLILSNRPDTVWSPFFSHRWSLALRVNDIGRITGSGHHWTSRGRCI